MIITLEELKQHIDLDSNEDDEILKLYIEAAGDYLEKRIGRYIEAETDITEYFSGDELDDLIVLANYPITSLTSLQYRTGSYSDPTWNDFDEDYYQLDDEKGYIEMDTMYSGKRNIKVVYNAGYTSSTMPNSIKLAVIKLVSRIYNKKRSDGFKTEEVAGASITWDKFLGEDVEELINLHRRILI